MTTDAPNTFDLRHYAQCVARARNLAESVLSSCENPIVTTKFNPHSGVLLHLLSTLKSDIPVIWVDHGFNSRDTHAFSQHLQVLLSLNLQTFEPQAAALGIPSDTKSDEHDAFVHAVKLEPMARAFSTLKPDIWFSSLRKSQTVHRASLTEREKASEGLHKVYPLLDWPEHYLKHYLEQHRIAIGPEAYDPTKSNARLECGLHTTRWIDTVDDRSGTRSI